MIDTTALLPHIHLFCIILLFMHLLNTWKVFRYHKNKARMRQHQIGLDKIFFFF